MKPSKTILAALVLATAATGAHAGIFDRRDDLTEAFLKPSQYTSIDLSPGGTMLARISIDDRGRGHVWVTDLDQKTEWPIAQMEQLHLDRQGSTEWAQPSAVSWLDEDLIAVEHLLDTSSSSHAFHARGETARTLDEHYLGTLRPDGKTKRIALATEDSPRRVVGVDLQDPSAPYTGEARWSATSGTRPLGPSFPETCSPLTWLTDTTGTVLAARCWSLEGDTRHRIQATWSRPAEGRPWKPLDRQSAAGDLVEPVALTENPDVLLVLARNGADRQAVWRYDTVHGTFGEAIASQPDADVVGVTRTSGLPGLAVVRSDGLEDRDLWIDERLRKLQAIVDRSFPGNVNHLQPGGSSRVLVDSSSDVDPGHAYVLDTRTLKMELVATRQPDLEPSRLQPMQRVHYPAADGLEVPAYLTMPGRPAKPVPLVVLMHDAPLARDRWGWNEEAQVFAAHGYAVLQPQVRGSKGFGRKFEDAGLGEWGRAMQDDIAAGVRWLASRRLVDPARVCIVGSGYGGYAALRGLEKTPALYRCGVSIAGVADLKAQLAADLDLARDPKPADLARPSRLLDPAQVVDPEEISVVAHADRIAVPVLMVHGDKDARVPLAQAQRMADALESAHKDVEWLAFPDEGHDIFGLDDRRKVYEAMFKLFKRTIGAGEPPAPR